MSSNNKQTPPMGGPHARGGFGKPKNFKKAWKNILSYTKPHRTSMIFAIIFAVFVTAITLTGPSLIEEITDLISAGLFGAGSIEIIASCLQLFQHVLIGKICRLFCRSGFALGCHSYPPYQLQSL